MSSENQTFKQLKVANQKTSSKIMILKFFTGYLQELSISFDNLSKKLLNYLNLTIYC